MGNILPPLFCFLEKSAIWRKFFAKKLQPHGGIFKNKMSKVTATKRVFPSLRVCMGQRNFAVSLFLPLLGYKRASLLENGIICVRAPVKIHLSYQFRSRLLDYRKNGFFQSPNFYLFIGVFGW